VLVAQPLEDPLRRMPLLGRHRAIVVQNLIDDPTERVELGPRRRSAPPIEAIILATVRGSIPK
jgi:hypothetical protein